MDPMEGIKQTYFQECEELLLAMEEGLIAMEGGAADRETVNAVFRAVHSIKGGGGAFGYTDLVAFAHVFETVLDLIRSATLEASPEVVKVLLHAGDVLADHVAAAREGRALASSQSADVATELEALAGEWAGEGADASGEIEGLDFKPVQVDAGTCEGSALLEPPGAAQSPAAGKTWHIRFAPHQALLVKGNEPFLLIRELLTLGEGAVTCDLSRLPELGALDVDQAYLAWDIALSTDAPKEKIEEIFEFVTGDCDLVIAENPARARLNEETRGESTSAGTGGAAQSAVEGRDWPKSKDNKDKKTPTADQGGGEVAVKQIIRVDLDKVDRLVNLVGELVITQAMLSQRVHECGLPSTSLVNNGLAELEHLLRELQDSVMAIRTQPVKSVFQRMPRLVRELAAQTGKSVRLVIEGEATEVDKTVIERLGEPLTHMIRNAVDHGIETAEVRRAAGKPVEGTIRLSAEHRGGRIVIEVADDGRGINRERVFRKAVEKGLIPATASLTDEEIDNLIFLPGFSTADQVSNISGRGVGMDVVRRNITELGGRIGITSTPGKGSRFSLTLPLTLAVLDGMVIAVGDQTFVVPLSHVVESLQPKPQDIRPFGQARSLLHIRNTYVPLVKVSEILNVPNAKTDPVSGVVILVESEMCGQLALAVDSILGQRQVVIKSFEGNYRHVDGIAAATILGDGRVALILDVEGIVARCRERTNGNRLHGLQRATGT